MRHSVSTARGRGITSAYSGGSSTAAGRSQMMYTSRVRPSRSPARRVSSTRSRAAADEHGAQPQVAGPHRRGCQRPGDRGGVGRDHGSDARGEPPGQLPHRPAPQR